jgi:hypothetical protein
VTDSLAPLKRGPGRPRKAPEELAHNFKSRLTLDGPIPAWIGYEDLKSLVRAYRGRMYDERHFRLWVEQGAVPSYFEKVLKTAVPSVRRRKYRWEEVRAWIDGQMEKAPARGIIVNGQFQPLQGRP